MAVDLFGEGNKVESPRVVLLRCGDITIVLLFCNLAVAG